MDIASIRFEHYNLIILQESTTETTIIDKGDQNSGASQNRLFPGTLLDGRYLIQAMVGRGGMAGVYCARDMHFPNAIKLVAVKEMLFQTDDSFVRDTVIQNFEREANILGGLSHHSIPHIADYFTRGDRSYLIMEYIQGKDLEKIIDDAPGFLPEEKIIGWAIEICDVLDYLHSFKPKPIVYRDIKPSNIMIDSNNHVFLIDFGIAKVFVTGAKGTMIGTEGFSPPEQYRGEATPRADIYSLGATLHYLMTKVDPREQAPFTFNERKVKNINPAISDALERVIEHAVKYKPEERYLTALEMKEDLTAILQTRSGVPESGNSVGDDSDTRTSGGIFAVKPVWVFACEDEIRNTPLYHNDIVYIGSYDRNLYALDANTGRMIWKSPTEAGITTKPAIFEHSIFVGSEDHNLYALSDRTGAVDWKYTTGEAIRSSPRIHNKVIYVGSDDGSMHAISATSGNTLWKTETSGPIRSSVYIDEDRLYFGGEEGEFYCMEISGNIKWRNKTKRSITSSAVVYKEEVIFSSLEGFLYALDKNSGWVIWRFRMQKGSISSPLIIKDYVYVGSADGYLYCVDTYRPVEKWKFKTEGQIAGSPAVYENYIYFGSTDGYLYCLDSSNGRMVWKYQTNGPITGSPTLFSHMLYIGSTDHKIYAFKV